MRELSKFTIIFLSILIIILFSTEMIFAQTNIEDSIKYQLLLFKDYRTNSLKIKRPYFSNELAKFYEKNNFSPIWYNNGFNDSALKLMKVIRNIEGEGLFPGLYRYDYLKKNISNNNLNIEDKALTEIILSNSYLLLISHFSNGLLSPETYDRKWHSIENIINIPDFLSNVSNKGSIEDSLYSLLPQTESYSKLKKQLNLYKNIENNGGFQSVNISRVVEKGMRGYDIKQIKIRLQQTDDFDGQVNLSFDKNLHKAVINFQRRHGLTPDGIVGKDTKIALNKDVEKKLKKITINMERLRWLPQKLGDTYIFVNIADYKLKVIEKQKNMIDMKVIVGKEQRSTPVFSDEITYLVINPAWNVPKSIAVEDKLPLIKENIDYLFNNNYKVLRISEGKFEEADPKEINWEELDKDSFHYYLKQEPGPNNALGRIKFMFPNKYSVYLHDTPQKELFKKEERSFSSGCIRLEEPFKLAEYILKKNDMWEPKKIEEILSSEKETKIELSEKIPIHIIYMTAWVDDEGQLQFRDDIYSRDENLIEVFYSQKVGRYE
ncbi:MAG: L,D-transpeptidase family protein [Halanaerobiales bacterium]|nr:L,D-transpeptidase family protein [Halanaerobiales bacterium]